MATTEKIRQKLSVTSGFKPTHNDRTKKMMAELTNHAKLIRGLQKQVRKLQSATDGMLSMVERAYTTDLPHDYNIEKRNEVNVKSEPVANQRTSDPDAKRAEISEIRSTLESRLKEQVYGPSNQWLDDVNAAKVDLKALEKSRLQLDAQRRRYFKAEYKKVRQERNMGTNTNTDTLKERMESEGHKLEEAKAKYETDEELLHSKLNDLVGRSNIIFDCMEQAFAVGNDVMNRAQSAAPASTAMSTGKGLRSGSEAYHNAGEELPTESTA